MHPLQRRNAALWGEHAGNEAARPESYTLPPAPAPVPPGLRPLRLVEMQRAKNVYRAFARPAPEPDLSPHPHGMAWRPRPPMQPRPKPSVPPMGVPPPEQVVPDHDCYAGCVFEASSKQALDQVASPTEPPKRPPWRGPTEPLNVIKRRPPSPPPVPPIPEPLPGPISWPPSPPPPEQRGRLAALDMQPRPPPPSSSMQPLNPAQVPAWVHARVLAGMRAQNHPLPELVRQAERGLPLNVCPSVVKRVDAARRQQGGSD